MDTRIPEEASAATDHAATDPSADAQVAGDDISRVNGLSPQQAAQHYIRHGWSVVPLMPQTKECLEKNWTSLRITEEQVPQYFSNQRCNIGVMTGEPSGGLVDLDLDCAEAVNWAPHFFRGKATASFGRKSKPSSHLLYRCPELTETKKFSFNKKMLLELRANGCQTMFPPSIHPDGEQVLWDDDELPAEVSATQLIRRAGMLAAAILLVRNWPAQGGRNDAASALCGILLRDEHWDVEHVKQFVTFVACYDDDQEWRKRESIAGRVEKALENGKKATGLPMMRKIFGTDVANQVYEWLGLKKEKSKKADVLANILSEVELWHSEDKQAFATISVNGHVEHHRVEGKSFKGWMQWRVFQETGKAAATTALNEIIGTATALATFQGNEHRTWLRVGEQADKLYLDLGDSDWTLVEIDGEGWRLCDASRVKLRRAAGNTLPIPVRGGSMDELRPFINVESEADFQLLVGFLVTCWRPGRPFPILSLAGEQGSAKTTTLRIISSLIDPTTAAARSLPKKEEDLVVTASNNWLVTADNISGFNAEIADALCRLATGGGLAKREFYTNGEEFKIDAQRPIVLNGINQLTERQDFLDRSLIITLARIEDDQRQDERSFWAAFEKVRPRILGALLDAVAVAQQRLPETRLETMPRMSDFVLWAEAAGAAFGWTEGSFLKTYEHMRDGLMEESARADPMSDVIYDWLQATRVPFRGTATKLFQELEAYVIAAGRQRVQEHQEWPKNASRLARRLRMKSAGLRALGIEYEERHDTKANTPIYLLSIPGIRDADEPLF
jgi:hypothetical protein